MTNNPDIQPSAMINRWIAGILLFNFKLKHVPGKDHASADRLSRRRQAPEDPIDDDDHKDWIDKSYAFGVELLNWTKHTTKSLNSESPYTQTYLYLQEDFSNRTVDWPSVLIGSLAQDHVEIPRTDRARARDDKILQVHKFLEDPNKISHPNDKEFKKFIRSATRFFINKGQLWRKDGHGKHKLVIPNKRRLDLIQQAHDDLGHKGIFTVRNRLLERFWWPNLNQDVKWYIQTCHECQIRLLHKIIIPPTIPIPRGLFRKVYVDTMLMPKAKGYRYIIHA